MVINAQTTQNMEITIESEIGEVIKVIDAGTQPPGNVEFRWDGTDANGNLLPPGNYVIKAQGDQFGESTSLPTAIHRHVDSVSLGWQQSGRHFEFGWRNQRQP